MNRISLGSIVFMGILFLVSCVEETHENLEIFIQNNTDSLIIVRLYPAGLSSSAKYYPICEECETKQESTEFALSTNKERILFSSGDLSVEPNTLVSMAFDSIYISSTNRNNVIIKFTPEHVTGYSENPFLQDSRWNFRIEEHDLQDMGGQNRHRYFIFRFLISKDKMTIQ
jgi:hypothetical protein